MEDNLKFHETISNHILSVLNKEKRKNKAAVVLGVTEIKLRTLTQKYKITKRGNQFIKSEK